MLVKNGGPLLVKTDTKKKELKFSGARKEGFKAILTALMSAQSLYVAAKALDVGLEHANLWCSSRVITDLRPLFDESDEPAAFLVSHNLRIKYHEGTESSIRKEIFIAMNGRDVRQLLTVLERALKKEEALRKTAETSNLPVLEILMR